MWRGQYSRALPYTVSSARMNWQVVLWLALVHLAQGMHLIEKPYYGSTLESNCIEYPSMGHDEIGGLYNEGWRSLNPVIRKVFTKRSTAAPVQFIHGSDRLDHILGNYIPRSDNLLKEHAKLVQDINSLRQTLFIVPFIEETKDYDDSIFHEIIETASTTTSRPVSSGSRYAASSTRYPLSSPRLPVSSTRPPVIPMNPLMSSTKAGSIPVILLGGASQRQIVKSQPITFAKPTISLVGTSVSPLIKHPYPFVVQSTTPGISPVKICMKTVSSMYSMLKEPSLWDRLINLFIPSRTLGR